MSCLRSNTQQIQSILIYEERARFYSYNELREVFLNFFFFSQSAGWKELLSSSGTKYVIVLRRLILQIWKKSKCCYCLYYTLE